MTTEKNGAHRSDGNHLVDELSEDLDVAIREFLDRHPGTSPHRIHKALEMMERRTGSGRIRRLVPLLALLAAFTVGLTLGLLLG